MREVRWATEIEGVTCLLQRFRDTVPPPDVRRGWASPERLGFQVSLRDFAAAPPPDVRRGSASPERRGFQVSLRDFAAASPPDVRRGSASPERFEKALGFAPRSAFGRQRAEPEPRAEPHVFQLRGGEAEPRLTSGGGAGRE
jgi:hypothetical protein